MITAIVKGGLSPTDEDFFDRRASNIAKKWKGLPLVAFILGHKLHYDHDKYGGPIEAIKLFEQTDMWELIEGQILTALRFDHQRLTPHLNKLVYFNLFPHDHSFDEDCLVQLRMAEGFIQLEEWTNRMLAHQHFEDVLPMSGLNRFKQFTRGTPLSISNQRNHTWVRSVHCL